MSVAEHRRAEVMESQDYHNAYLRLLMKAVVLLHNLPLTATFSFVLQSEKLCPNTAVGNICRCAQEEWLFCVVWLEDFEWLWDVSVYPEGLPSAQWNIKNSQCV